MADSLGPCLKYFYLSQAWKSVRYAPCRATGSSNLPTLQGALMNTRLTAMAFAFSTALGGLSVQAQTTQGAQPAAGTQATQPGTSTQAAQPAANPQGQSQLTQEDANFLENAIQGSHAEVEGSQLALEKTSSQDVKDFAQMMIKDHQMMAKEASGLAKEKGMTPPDGPSAMQVTEITALKALSGGAFDAMYVNRIGVAS